MPVAVVAATVLGVQELPQLSLLATYLGLGVRGGREGGKEGGREGGREGRVRSRLVQVSAL